MLLYFIYNDIYLVLLRKTFSQWSHIIITKYRYPIGHNAGMKIGIVNVTLQHIMFITLIFIIL